MYIHSVYILARGHGPGLASFLTMWCLRRLFSSSGSILTRSCSSASSGSSTSSLGGSSCSSPLMWDGAMKPSGGKLTWNIKTVIDTISYALKQCITMQNQCYFNLFSEEWPTMILIHESTLVNIIFSVWRKLLSTGQQILHCFTATSN